MRITVCYTGQARSVTGVPSEELSLNTAATLETAVKHVCAKHGENLRLLLLDASGTVQPTLLLFVNDEQVVRGETPALQEGDEVLIMVPISGG